MRGLLVAAALSVVAAAPVAGAEFFPVGQVFSPLAADPAEPRSFVSVLRARTTVDRFTMASAGFGTNFGVVRWPGDAPGEGWQTGVFGVVFSQFNLSAPSDALINSDFVIGVPFAVRRGPLAARLRLWHQSSHLGDELILNGGAPPRIDLSVEIIDTVLAWGHGGWRGYGGASYVVRRDQGHRGRTGLQAGIDYAGASAALAGGRLVGGFDVKWFEQADWDAGVSAKVGLEFGRPRPERRGLTVLAETYDGFAPFGQFTSREVRYYGVGLQFDF
jgi:hypothetical protein